MEEHSHLFKVQDSPMTSCMVLESDTSMDNTTYSMKGANLTDQKDTIDLSPILQRLEDSVLKFWLDEMKTYKRDLSQEYPHQFDSNLENSNVLNDVTMMLQKCAREGALKITLHSLWISNQESLAHTVEENEVLRTCQEKLKSSLRNKSEYVFEGLPKQGYPTLLNDIYTDMYITEGGRGEVEDEHEVGQIENVSKRAATQETVIKSNDIFNPLPGQEGTIRSVLTKGVAGIGKTVSVQKIILDWAEGKANQDICFILALPFRVLNLIKHEDYSLIQIIHNFFPEMQELKSIDSDQNKVLLIFDGLDECQLPLDFQNNETCCDAHESTSVDVLLTNLIKGNLLPSALLWITTRPAAANRIPPECFYRVTEVRGFNDQQKEEYFTKKILDKSLASRITTHVKSSRSLYILCHIPVICWIVANVLQGLLVEACSNEIPCTLTQMYSNLVALQLQMKSKRSQSTNQSKSEDDIIQKLGELAFQQLETGNLVFYEEDLKEIDIDVSEASEYSSWFTEIFKEEFVLHQKRIFCFVHLSVQEFLAALFVFLTFQRSGKNLLDKSLLARLSLKGRSLINLYKSAVDRALQSQNGHLDLFLRFLLGLSLESNQAALKGLTQTQAGSSTEDIQRTVQYIKEKIKEYPSPQRCINLFHCLNELNDNTLVQEIQRYLSLGSLQVRNLTPTQWSALAFVLLTSQEDLDVFELKKYVQSDGGLLRLLPVVKLSRMARLDGCNLTDKCCDALASVIGTSSSLVELDLSDNNLQDSGVKLLSKGLGNPHCNLEILRLSLCGITDEGCVSLAMALSSNSTHLKELDLSFNYPEESGVEQLSALLEDPHCKLEALSIDRLGSSREKWRLLKYACQLTLDSNTANKMLRISEDGRNVAKTREVQLYADHPDRFSLAIVQVLCRESLSDRCYWEVEFGCKTTKIAATYRGIPKMEDGYKSWLGWNEMSWSWYCTDDGGFSARHNRKRTPVCAPPTDSNRVGVYLDWPAGTLTLYSVTFDMVTLLHTFYTTFTEPIYPAFSVVDTLCICPIESTNETHEYAQ
ncbi:NLR family CARD domain-containing protein 3 isoform X2 [Salmo trutta]|uniref:NLR family CARD domain-containing protein 3 isoform X2 n=1 Tax=Salmo trutta TaxID=8032 RepID=UPI00113144FD|nr:NLR family CARD domain-containing protein 3-like isoform X2 [Salmo trutta]